MQRGERAKQLLANPAVAALVSDLAIRVGTYVIRQGVNRLLPQAEAPAPPPRKKRKLLRRAAPVVAVAGTGALARFLYRRSEARRRRLADKRP